MNVKTPYTGFDKLDDQFSSRVKEFLKKANDYLKDGKRKVIGIAITETRRSRLRQKWLWAFGRTRQGPKVTWTLRSNHQSGKAVDVAFIAGSGKLTYEGPWSILGEIGESCGLNWGGRWQTPDRPHFEYNSNWMKDHWAKGAEWFLQKKGYLKYEKDLFAPLSRGEFYEILMNVLKNKFPG